jgi:hypothetical protein
VKKQIAARLSQPWLAPLFTNHGLKDNQGESDFFDEAALFLRRVKSIQPHLTMRLDTGD